MPFKDKEKNRDYQLNYHHKYREAWFEGKSCKLCSSTRNLRVFSYTIRPFPHAFWSWGKDRREEILQHCIPLCATHHRLESIRLQRERDDGLDQLQPFDPPVDTITPDEAVHIAQPTTLENQSITVEGKLVTITLTIKID